MLWLTAPGLLLALQGFHGTSSRVVVNPSRAVVRMDARPSTPTDTLDCAETVRVVCDGLRFNDEPHEGAGISRLYEFMTPMGRVKVAPPPPRGGLQGGVSLEYFLEKAGSKFLGELLYAESCDLIGEPKITPGTNTRGQLATQLIEVGNSPLNGAIDAGPALTALSGAPEDFLEGILESVRQGKALPAPPSSALVKSRFWVSLEQERRPPLQGCWLIKEMLPLEKSRLQELNEGGEEFDGADTG